MKPNEAPEKDISPKRNKREKQQKYCCDCKWLSSGIFEEGRCQKKYDKVPFWCPACEYFEEIKTSKL